MTKEKMAELVQEIGEPVKLGGYLSTLSAIRGWTDELCQEYEKYFGENNITAASFGFTQEDNPA
jgi:hypothetical protein